MNKQSIQPDLLNGRRNKRAKLPSAKEGAEQEALFQWAELNTKKYPELELLYHIPNGGRRPPWEARAFKRRGVKPGIPDICLPVPRHGYGSLWIELKRKGGKPTREQFHMLDALSDHGNLAIVCEGWEVARDMIRAYLSDVENRGT